MPFESVILRERIELERMLCRRVLPCVPVEIAPAIDWSLMLPKLGMASPTLSSSAPIVNNRTPLCITTTHFSLSTDKILLKLSRLTSQLDVQVMSDGECAHPTVVTRRLHLRARLISFSTSAMDSGCMKSSGEEWKVRAHVDCVWFVTARKGMSSWNLESSTAKAGSIFGFRGGVAGSCELAELLA